MTDYRSVTHTIVELLARRKIQAVPRLRDDKRTELKNVARPEDDRRGEIPYRQQAIQKQIIDETKLAQDVDPTKVKKPKKLEIEDIGKQPPTKVEISPELDNSAIGLNASTEVKGKLVEKWVHPAVDPKVKKAFDAANKLKRHQKSHDFQGDHDTPDPRQRRSRLSYKADLPHPLKESDESDRIRKEVAKAQAMQKARKEAEEVAKHVSKIKSFDGMKVTGSLTAKNIEHGADIRRRLNTLKESRNDYTNVSIQYQTKGGNWVTVRKVPDTSSNIMLAMRNVQKTYSSSRVRAIGPKGSVLDFQPIDPSEIVTEETSTAAIKQKQRSIPQGPDRTGTMAKAMREKIAKARYARINRSLRDKDLDEANILGQLAKSATIAGASAIIPSIEKKFPIAVDAVKKVAKGYSGAYKYDPTSISNLATAGGEGDMLTGLTKNVQARIRTGRGAYPGAQKEETQISPGISTIERVLRRVIDGPLDEILSYKNSASLRARDAYAQQERAVAAAQQAKAQAAQQQQQAQQQQPQQPPEEEQPPQRKSKSKGIRTPIGENQLDELSKETAKRFWKDKKLTVKQFNKLVKKDREADLDKKEQIAEAKDPRHTGIEVDEPKFGQSIQKVAGHARIYSDVTHTYKHADGSKTKVNQELGKKIHNKIHSTPHRHRADLIQKMHKSTEALHNTLKEAKSNPAPVDVVGYLARGKGGIADRLHRSGEAKALENPVFRKRVVRDKTKYSRKAKHKNED